MICCLRGTNVATVARTGIGSALSNQCQDKVTLTGSQESARPWRTSEKRSASVTSSDIRTGLDIETAPVKATLG